MKIRNGFVSNSSSSSFIINGKINNVANSMLGTVMEDYFTWDGTKTNKKEKALYATWKKNLAMALENKDVQDGKIGITMPSCNYDTYILKVNDEIHVSTCRNHNWDLDYVKSGGGDDEGSSDIVYKTIEKAKFFNIRNRLIHSKEKYDARLKKCTCKLYYGQYVVCNGKKLCGGCYKEIKK